MVLVWRMVTIIILLVGHIGVGCIFLGNHTCTFKGTKVCLHLYGVVVARQLVHHSVNAGPAVWVV